MLRRGEERRRGPHLHDFPEIHDRDTVADVLHETKIVRDEEVRQLQPLLKIHQQIDHLRLNGHVERRHRLVENDERRIEGERARKADALPLTAAELVRVALEVCRVQADELEQLADAAATLVSIAEAVNDQRFLDDLTCPHPRVQRRVWVLKDDLHVAPRLPHLARGQREHLAAAESHVAGGRLDEPKHASPRRRLAASRFAHQPERFAFNDAEAHVVDRPDDGA
jgi:hypothetical protein